jgi:hypothetical protein
MSKKSWRNQHLQPGKAEKAQDGFLPSIGPEHHKNPASFVGAGVEIENRSGMEPYTKPGGGDSHLDRNNRVHS